MKKIIIFLAVLLFSATKVAIIDVEGMTCPLCTTAIKRSLKTTEGVLKAKVLLNTHTATVLFDDTKVDKNRLLNAIKRVGYKGKIISIKEAK